MCGISGLLRIGASKDDLTDTVCRMSDALIHRGPDDNGSWVDKDAGIGLSHRRLAISDLSLEGHQPMVSDSGRYVLVFNGEIYNHKSIRADLAAINQAPDWRGHSDTETLLAAVDAWGLNLALQRFNGMFALALWDRQENVLSLSRDRMGEKPLYVAKIENGWAFSSELKALHHVTGFKGVLRSEAVAAFIAYGYVPDNQCIFHDVLKVSPGGIFKLSVNSKTPELTKFYELSADISFGRTGLLGDRPDTKQGAVKHIGDVLGKVIEEQMISDVPLGCFLSGGVDSSLVAALMQAQSSSSVLTFSIGFKEVNFNEAPHARAVAHHLNTDHTEFTISEDDALTLVKDLPYIYDEPFADSSQIPTILLCREARKAVTVALTGDGGDEIFGGYNRYVAGPKLLRQLRQVPVPLRRQASRLAVALSPYLTTEGGWVRRVAMKMNVPVNSTAKLAALSPRLAEVQNEEDLYRCFTRIIDDPMNFLKADREVSVAPSFPGLHGSEWMMAMDSVSYLPGDILVKVDRASMASSLETRAPFLDARVVSEAWRLPLDVKIASGTGKWVLREILYQHVPKELIDRPKQGFSIPLDRWLRGALRGWGEDLLNDYKLFEVADIDQQAVLDLWDRHQSKKANLGAKLWNFLTFLDWVRVYQDFIVHPSSEPSSAYL